MMSPKLYPTAFSAYDLPSVEALVQYFHAAAGYPVRETGLKILHQVALGRDLVLHTRMPSITAQYRLRPLMIIWHRHVRISAQLKPRYLRGK